MKLQKLYLLLLLATAVVLFAMPARAERDAVQFGSRIHIPVGSTADDVVCFFCSVNVEGEVNGDVVVFFGNIQISGSANHDVVNFFGNISANTGVSIGEDLVSFFGRVRLGDNVSVGKDLVAIFGTLHAPSSVNIGNDRVVWPGWLFFGPLFVIGLIVFVLVREYRDYYRRLRLRGYPFPPKQ
jgi:hypothetical protein